MVSQSRLEQAAEATWGITPAGRFTEGTGSAWTTIERAGGFTTSFARCFAREERGARRFPPPAQDEDDETEEAVIDALLCSARSLPSPPRSGPACRSPAGRRAWCAASLADDLSITRCAALLGMPLRTIELGFQDLYGTSLRVYRHALRLNAARRDLLRGDSDDSVGVVAVRWGLYHLGRFSIEYRRMFGESPSETRRATRRRR